MKQHLCPMAKFRLESARGLNGHYNLPSIEEYNKAVKEKRISGVPIDSSHNSLLKETNTSNENNSNSTENVSVISTPVKTHAPEQKPFNPPPLPPEVIKKNKVKTKVAKAAKPKMPAKASIPDARSKIKTPVKTKAKTAPKPKKK